MKKGIFSYLAPFMDIEGKPSLRTYHSTRAESNIELFMWILGATWFVHSKTLPRTLLWQLDKAFPTAAGESFPSE